MVTPFCSRQLISLIAILTSITATAQPAWQQRVDTKIDVRLDDKKHFLRAYEELSYTNNSPDTLRFIYIHLWPNAYKNDRTPFERQQDVNGSTLFYYSKPKDKGYIDSLQFTVDGAPAEHYSSEKSPDIARLDLPKALLPGHTIKITTPFLVKIPKVFSRMGHTGQAYYISQWFPKPAVYDTKGWHPISYLDQGEFFSEYGTYDVSITLPSNYVLMATGNCTDEKENQWMDELSQRPLPTIKYKTHKDTIPPSSPEMKTVHFHEENIHDFAWFADKRWLVRKDTVYSPGNGQLVTTWAAFMPSYWKQWQKATGYLKETVNHYGKWVGPYQYKTIKAVLGDLRAGGGMEYPTVTVIDKTASSDLKTVVVHEAGHNWFYGMLGSNERDHAWMDEGINTFYEQKTTRDLNHDSSKVKKKTLDEALVLFEREATHTDQAIDQTSANFEKLNYGLDIYFKTALSLNWLEKYMGAADFEKGMHDYYSSWHYHHPYPDDFRVCMQRNTSKPIGWFFDTTLTSNKKIDFTILKAHANGDNTIIKVRNNTGVSSPVLIDACYKDSITASAWTPSFTHTTTLSVPTATWRKLKIDDVIPDAKSDNDVYRKHAIFHHFGIQLKPLVGLNLYSKDQIFVSPAVAYNQYDGIMAGLLIHDLTLPENRFRYALAPLYSFETKSIVGAGSIGYLWYPENVFKEIMLQADGKTFHYKELSQPSYNLHLNAGYTKIAPSLTFTFNEHNPISPVVRTLTLKGYSINEDYFYSPATAIGQPEATLRTQQKTYGVITYKHKNNRTYNPFSYNLQGQLGADFAKLSAEGNLKINYNTPHKALYVRAFLGKFFPISGDLAVYSRYELNTSYSGLDDYLYDGTYLGRNATNNLASQQIATQEGGFKVPVFNNADRSDNWMATVNLKTNLPLKKLPVLLFFDAGIIPNQTPSLNTPGATTLLYDGGIEIQILKGVVSVYLPLIMSNDFQNYISNAYGHKNAFAHSVSFTMQFQNLNWLKTPATLLKTVIN